MNYEWLVLKMEFLSISGKKYMIERKEFLTELLRILIDDFEGEPLLPNSISDDDYEIIFNFLNSGKIAKINDQIISNLDFLGYDIPEYGFSDKYSFPEEFKYLWLEEDWIRRNLLYLPDYGISRLIKYQDVEILNDSILIPEINIKRKIIPKLNKYDQYVKNNFFLAGGSITSVLNNRHPKDYDYFYVDLEDGKDPEEQIKLILKDNNRYAVSTNSITINRFTQRQFILRRYKSIAEVVFGFDIEACAMILFRGEIYITPKCAYSIKNKQIVVDLSRCSTSYEYRLVKYYKKGFNIYIPGFDKNKVNLANQNLIKNYIKRLKFSLSYNVKCEKLILNFITDQIELEGLDIVLFFLAIKKPRGFNKSKENRVYISDYDQPEDTYLDTENIDDKLEKLTSKKWELSKNGIKITRINRYKYRVYSRGFIELEQSDLDYLRLDLKPKLEFKTQNPGEQISGTFHKKVYTNPDLWFQGFFYENNQLPNIRGIEESSRYNYVSERQIVPGITAKLKNVFIDKGQTLTLYLLKFLSEYYMSIAIQK